MRQNDLVRLENSLYRILSIELEKVIVVDCKRKSMPFEISLAEIEGAETLRGDNIIVSKDLSELSPKDRAIAIKRYSIIANILTVISDKPKRTQMIDFSAKQFGVSKQTVRNYLYMYLVYQNIAVLAPTQKTETKELTPDQKNMRWALNKYFYTQHKNTLATAYTYLLKEKYCDAEGKLLENYPTFCQFRYFYRQTRKLENFYISRNGIKEYQRNHRPLLGDGVQSYAPIVGTAMLDATVCDIYLVNDKGELVGRPILVSACDANTSLCLGYSLLWEGGTYSLTNLMQNIITDKVKLCQSHGIPIQKEQWDSDKLPSVMVTDMGSEYKGITFEQITELGVTLVNLPPFRPDLKGVVEKLFDVVQDSFKEVLKGKGVIMPDFNDRGAHDYRLDAVLTMEDFERIVIKAILFYNSGRIIENYPYTKEMLDNGVKPYASEIWNWMISTGKSNQISVPRELLALTLLPRTTGRFTRQGLKVGKLRYFSEGYKEQFLKGGEITVSYRKGQVQPIVDRMIKLLESNL